MNLKGKNVVITGGGRGIGLSVGKMLVKHGCNLSIIDNNLSLKKNILNHFRAFTDKVKFIECDVSKENLSTIIQKSKTVIHLAALTNAELSFKNPLTIEKNNFNSTKRIADYCSMYNVPMIHVSSTSVYGKQANIVDENCEEEYLKPQSPYADIKLIEEKMLKKESPNLIFNTFRFGTIAGVSKGIRFHTAVNKFCLNAAINEDIQVYKTALNQFRPYLSLSDALKSFQFCIEKDFFQNDIFNILSGNFTVNQILKMIKKYKKKIKVKLVDAEIMNQLSYHVSKEKIEKEGLHLNHNIENDIKNTLKLLGNI